MGTESVEADGRRPVIPELMVERCWRCHLDVDVDPPFYTRDGLATCMTCAGYLEEDDAV